MAVTNIDKSTNDTMIDDNIPGVKIFGSMTVELL